MVSFERVGELLDEAAEKLPKEIFTKLNGGVNLLHDLREEDGMLTMGMYIVDQMGKRVEIYYGSFCEAFADASEDEVARELEETLKHELTHHIEVLAGDRSLERWDEQHRLELISELDPLEATSVLFISRDDCALSPLAAALFRKICEEQGLDVKCESAGLVKGEAVDSKCTPAAATLGVDISSYSPKGVRRALIREYDAVLCMTSADCEELANRFPLFDDKIMCLGPTDCLPPRLGLKSAWLKKAREIYSLLEMLASELTGEEEDDGAN